MTPRRAATERTLLSRAVLLTLGVGALCALAAGLLRGGAGLVGAAFAVGLVLAFLLVGQLPVAQAARGRRRLGAALLVVLYLLRVLLLVLAYALVVASGDARLDREALGVTVVASALAWTAGTVWSALRWRPMVVEPETPVARRGPRP